MDLHLQLLLLLKVFGTTTEQKQYTFTDRNVTAGVNHAYRLKQIDFNGTFEYSQVVNVGSTLPIEFALEQNYPNPFNPYNKYCLCSSCKI